MRKIRNRFIFKIALIMIGIYGLAGCGQVNNESKVSIGKGTPTGLSIQGKVSLVKIVYTNSFGLINSTLVKTDAPVDGAYVSFTGSSSEAVKTDADGNYNFQNVSAGSYTMIATKEGFQKGTTSGSFSTDKLPDNSILTLNIDLIDNPQILSVKVVSPEVIITFNEPMDTASVLPDLSYNGPISSSFSALGAIEIDKSWDIANSVLTIKPKSGFIPGSNYSVKIAGQDGTYIGVKDKDGNSIDPTDYLSSGGTSIYINLSSSQDPTLIPTAPSNLRVLTKDNKSVVDYSDVYSASNNLSLLWDSVSKATSYKIYCRINNSPFQLYNSTATNSITINSANVDTTLSDFQRTGSSYPQDQGNGIIWPFVDQYAVDFKVTAVNGNGESSPSEILTIKDTVNPQVVSASVVSPTIISIYFNEPLDESSIKNVSNYSISGQTISNPILNNYSDGPSAKVTLTLSPGTPSGVVEVSNLTDLTGNIIDPNKKSATLESYLFNDDAESGGSKWDSSGFSLATNQSNSPSHSFYSGKGDNLVSTLTLSSPILISGSPALKFYCYYLTETNWDFIYIQVSEDKSSWTTIEIINGDSTSWELKSYSLSNYNGKSIYIRFKYETDSSVIKEGFYVDDIVVE